jgi:hypothetical protein
MIAQEVEQLFPQWVDEGADGFKRLTLRGFEALVVEALRELREERTPRSLRLRHPFLDVAGIADCTGGP